MNSVPSLPSKNRYALLSVESINDIDDSPQYPNDKDTQIPETPPTIPDQIRSTATGAPEQPPRFRRNLRPKWERRLPKQLVIASTPGENSLHLPVELETTDTGEITAVKSLVDSGATGLFIDRDYVQRTQLATRKLSEPIPVFNVDGTPNEQGFITEVVDILLRHKNHSERALFAVTGLGKEDMILGHSWLKSHNPEINWQTGEVKMTRCPPACCSGCRDEARKERLARKAEIRRINSCSAGPVPMFVEEEDEDEDPPLFEPSSDDPEIEDGDRIWATGLLPPSAPSAHINAGSTMSQRLAEAFLRNSEPKEIKSGGSDFKAHVPDYLHQFESVFSKDSFDVLPESKPWDHAIELIPGAKPSGCKVYPLAPSEQKELDAFLEENLSTGRIRSSKSPMASPVFFIKKKDGSLRLVQDYRALNEMTVKNKYPLPLISELITQLRGAKYFTKLDVRWGFNNVRMKSGDEWKAAFRTN